MKWIWISALTLLLSGCDNSMAADGYDFGTKEFHREKVEVTFVEHPSSRELLAYAKQHNITPDQSGGEVMAFAYLSATQPKCTIHYVDPAVRYKPEWLGHEVAHCIYGRWHPGN